MSDKKESPRIEHLTKDGAILKEANYHVNEEVSPDIPTQDDLVLEPGLEISREPSPDTLDETALSYTDLAPESPCSENDGGRNSKVSFSLNTDQAIITRDEADGNAQATARPPLAIKETHRKRVTGKAIEKQWVTFESESLKSFEALCAISMNSVVERFKHSKQNHSKVEETQRILTQHWLSSKLPKSFNARLRVTKLPPLRSLVVRMKGDRGKNFDPLNTDQVQLRKTVFETYLLAELKQLEGLESYRSSLQNTYELDLEYLNDFKKTTSALQGQMSQEKTKTARELHLDTLDKNIFDINLAQELLSFKPTLSSVAHFDPDEDDDLKSLLDGLHDEVSKLDTRRHELLSLCDQLDIIERQLYMRHFQLKSSLKILPRDKLTQRGSSTLL